MATEIDRPELTADDLNAAIDRLRKEVAQAMNTKGRGAFVSRHEPVRKSDNATRT